VVNKLTEKLLHMPKF